MRRLFDPETYLVVLLDQRGAGRSIPHAADVSADDPSAALRVNTTWHLVADLERLREHLDIERWLVYGVSWGCTLAQAYAQTHPERVSEVVLQAVTLTRARDVEWLTRGVGRFFPEQWRRFRDALPPQLREGNLAAGYAQVLTSSNPRIREEAARAWCAWEDALASIESGGRPDPRYEDPRFRLGFARLVTHYFAHAAWLDDEQLLDGARRLGRVPAVLIHGQLDLGSPPEAAWLLHEAWPGSQLTVLPASGHSTADLTDSAVRALDHFAGHPD
jgi:proline iminopeptidase